MIMKRILTDLQNHPSAWPFLKPVNREEVVDYYDVIKKPMGWLILLSATRNSEALSGISDFETMEVKLESNQYAQLDGFVADAIQVFANCRTYNAEGSNYVKNANKLERYLKERQKVPLFRLDAVETANRWCAHRRSTWVDSATLVAINFSAILSGSLDA